jgi:alpha/beta superfamily hydrolase
MGQGSGDLELAIQGVAVDQKEHGVLTVALSTTRGQIDALYHPAEGEGGALVCVGGALGGYNGPAKKIYERLGRALSAQGISTLRVNYRQPGEFVESVLDVLGALSFLKGVGAQRVVLVGHSFGGAVVIKAGELSPLVSGVISLSPQLYGTREVERLGRPLLLVHGLRDDILSAECSKDIYERALEPKEVVLLEESDHLLEHDAEKVFELVKHWVIERTRNLAHLN